jgi:hypothetical protein
LLVLRHPGAEVAAGVTDEIKSFFFQRGVDIMHGPSRVGGLLGGSGLDGLLRVAPVSTVQDEADLAEMIERHDAIWTLGWHRATLDAKPPDYEQDEAGSWHGTIH